MFKITAKFFFDNGQVKRIDWLEGELIKKVNIGGKDTEVPLTLEEVDMEFRKLFLKYMKNGDVLTVPNVMGKTSVIPFSKLYYAEVNVAEHSTVTPIVDSTIFPAGDEGESDEG